MSATADTINWDGRVYPYIPGDRLDIDPSLELHTEAADEIDPITYEVIRHAMWNINVEHGNTIMKVSGSPICAYGHDFNPCLLDEVGGFVFFGPFLQYLSSASGSAIKWTLEHRSENPGIREGDIFLTNDPWIGATHQSDVTLMAPVFCEGKLFCWVANTLHQWDLGGTSPGGFNPVAEDVFWESGCIPPIKIVEGGVLRRDLEEEYIRRSRMPDLVALDLRAEIAGCNVALKRMLGLIERYGAATIKGVMRKLQNDSQKAFKKRLDTIPDGTWRESTFVEMKSAGDRHLYRNTLSLTKRGDKLIFSNEGTDPQGGTLNCTLIGWKGAIASMISAQMLFDQMFVVEGAYRHMEFEVVPGTLTCATYPAAVSAAPALALLQSIALAGLVISKMLACSSDEQLRSEVQSSMGTANFPISAISGTNQRNEPFSSFLLDPVGAALAGLSWKDGVDTGGFSWDLQSTMPNVEENEWFYPILYLWRRELPSSGGAGKFRGGNSAELAFIPHGTDRISMFVAAGHCAVPEPGLFGGLSPSPTRYSMFRGADVARQSRETGLLPRTLDDLGGEREYIPPKAFNIQQNPEDVFVMSWSAAGGYGDPLERDPDRVATDVRDSVATADAALQFYGVILDGHGGVDADATAAKRSEMRAARLVNAPPGKRAKIAGDDVAAIAEGLLVADRAGHRVIGCSKCRCELCGADQNFKDYCAVTVLPLTAVNPWMVDPKIYIDDEVVLRNYACPDCGLLLTTELERPDQPPLWDIQLAG